MSKYHDYAYPGETNAYRHARDELLAAEIDLRRKIAEVAEKRRSLLPGTTLAEDYLFAGVAGPVRLSSLFQDGHDCLVLYSFMFVPGKDPCPMCTSVLDGLNGNAPHITQRISLGVVAKASVDELINFADERNWKNLNLMSTANNSYNRDYLGESKAGAQMPMLNVFMREADQIRHFYGTEMLLAKSEQGQDPRHVDMVWPLWNLLDLTPAGRADWYPNR